ncbi:MAG: MFS transporter [Burkholderiaceae bacterium]|nr:MFS transporter [Burkholderiaceae bacterium]
MQKIPMLQPLRHRRFRQLWLANLVANLGTWTQTFAAAWLVAAGDASSQMTALVQAAASAPMLLLGLLAGVVADAVPRARLLLLVNAGRALAATLMALLAASGQASAWAVLALVFMMGTAQAFMWPAWHAVTSLLVTAEEVEAAATLNNLSYNVAASAGPALGGLLFAWCGAAPLFGFTALSMTGLLGVYYAWQRSPDAPRAGEPVSMAAFRSGLRTALGAPDYRRLLRHTACALFGAVAFMALLPLYVHDVLRQEAGLYGGLMALLSVGAIAAPFILPALRVRYPRHVLLAASLALFGAMLVALPLVRHPAVLAPLVMAGGMAWAAMVSTLNGAAQSAFPSAVRARTLSVYLLAMALGQTVGSAVWGAVAQAVGTAPALALAGAVLLGYAAIGLRRALPSAVAQ